MAERCWVLGSGFWRQGAEGGACGCLRSAALEARKRRGWRVLLDIWISGRSWVSNIEVSIL
jgi:hypothetical protein